MINVTKPYLPDPEKYKRYIDQIFASGQITNNGQLVRQLETSLTTLLGVRNLLVVANGTLALQIAYKALALKGDVITSPFTFVATASSIIWEGLRPVFADIDAHSLCLDPRSVEAAFTPETSAIVPVHVFGIPCNVSRLQAVADEHDVKLIYDASHAFGTLLEGRSLLGYGDIATLSFHATKLFHTVEGGALVTDDDELFELCKRMRNFGMDGRGDICGLGINAKMSEFHAAMGLCVLDDFSTIQTARRAIYKRYRDGLEGAVLFPGDDSAATNNHGYAPVIFASEAERKAVAGALLENGISARRYFYPSLDELGFVPGGSPATRSQDISGRILCLPIFPGLAEADQLRIIGIVRANVSSSIA